MSRKNKAKYPDTLFGELGKRNVRGLYHLNRILGVHHWDRIQSDYRADSVELLIEASHNSQLVVKAMRLLYSTDDWASSQLIDFTKTIQSWDTPAWTWLQGYQAKLSLPKGSLLRYYVYAELADGSTTYADNQAKSQNQATQFARWLNPKNSTPNWAKEARIYQIFVDRFNPGEGREWLQSENLLKPFGGTIRGVIEKIDSIRALGFNTLWLTPSFHSASHHGYDIIDYEQIDPKFGTEADLVELIEELHQRGMRLLLDFVANHCSDKHPAFQSALASASEAENGWFNWKEWPNNYECFYDVPTMPVFNLRFGAPARQHLLDAAQKWLKMGIDGYRLDYANGPSRDFWVDFQRACLEINPNAWTFGEVVAPAEEQAQLAGSMHGTLDFLTCQALRESFATRNWNASRLAAYIQAAQTAWPSGFSRPAFIDNHDMNRFLFSAEENFEALKAALRLLYLLPQPPVIYYGTEFGLSQRASIHAEGSTGFDEARLQMPWENPPHPEIGEDLRMLADFRMQNPWLIEASWHVLEISKDGNLAKMSVSDAANRLILKIETKERLSLSFSPES
ncbi:MAG: hypothetical protein KBA03_02390 [Anaerolineaceae bacterium]|nr:hypothetical protein [Anaerolineaceae bacterium]